MQFHLNGFQAGDPKMHARLAEIGAGPARESLDVIDVLIVGSGPAGLTLAAQLSMFPELSVRIVEQKAGPLQLGQADGVACRTMEMFNAFGFSERVLREAYWVNETTFWKPGEDDTQAIVRSGRVWDVEDGLSEFPHVILNQARVHAFYLDLMRKSPAGLQPEYSRRLVDLHVDEDSPDREAADDKGYPVTAQLERLDPGHEGECETLRARYVVGCDGARSTVRKLIGRELRGASANQTWGVMDILAVTDFPDIRFKSIIQSAEHGSIVLIPREGGYLVRIYVELDKLMENERLSSRKVELEHLVATAQRILRPYRLDVKEVPWWSVYEIGQRMCSTFDDLPESHADSRTPRIFIAGDACHTHSPKAGQGMNVSMQDTFNLGWKLAAVLRGQCGPELLHSYSLERRAVAEELIAFDRAWVEVLHRSETNPTISEEARKDAEAEAREYFVQHGRYTAGTATQYRPSILTGDAGHQHLASGFVVGTRFHSAPVARLADGKPMQLGHTIEADGRWRIFIFSNAQDPTEPSSPVRALCDYLVSSSTSPILAYTSEDSDIDAVIDVRAVFQQDYRMLDIAAMHRLLLPQKGRYGLQDYEKMFCPDLRDGLDIFQMRGIDRQSGCMVIVRPDQYIGLLLPLDAHAELSAYFARFMNPCLSKKRAVEGVA